MLKRNRYWTGHADSPQTLFDLSGRGDVRSQKNPGKPKKTGGNSGPTPFTGSGRESGAKAPPAAVRPYVDSSPGSPVLHLLDRHRDIVGCNAIGISPMNNHWNDLYTKCNWILKQ